MYMSEKDLIKNKEHIEKNKQELLKEYPNKYLLVYKEKVINSFDTYEKAAQAGVMQFGTDENFLVYHLTETEPLNFIMEAIL